MKFLHSVVFFLARLCLAGVFIFCGIEKMYAWNDMIGFLKMHGLVWTPELLLGCAIIIEVGVSLAFIFGMKTKFMAFLLLAYLAAVTYYFHNFWEMGDPQQVSTQIIQFLKNLAIVGGFLTIITTPQPKEPSELG